MKNLIFDPKECTKLTPGQKALIKAIYKVEVKIKVNNSE